MEDKNRKYKPGGNTPLTRMSRNKKGISVLVAWILLILLTVSIGTAVYSWMKSYSSQNTEVLSQKNEQQSCESAALSIINACQTSNFIYVDLRNQKNLKIEGISVNLITLYDDINTFKLNKSINVGRTERFEIPKQGTVKKMIVIPAIKVNDNFVYCVGSKVSIEDIKYC